MKRVMALTAGIVAVVATVTAGAAEEARVAQADAAASAEQGQENDRYSELVKEKGEFQETWLLPDIDPSKFNKVFIWEGQFEYRDVGPALKTRLTMMSTHKREFGISEEDRRRFEEIVREAFMKEFSKAKNFTIIENIDDVDAATLILRGGLFDIISRVPPEAAVRSDIYLSSVGETTFALELIDAQSGTVVAMVAERRSIIETQNFRLGMGGVPANSATIMSDIRRWAAGLARRLRSALDKAIKEGGKS